jgi:hypothetical protein
MFLHVVRFADHVLRSGVSGGQNFNALFFMLGWARCGSEKKCNWTRYTELVFLHLMRSMGHVVHFWVSGA